MKTWFKSGKLGVNSRKKGKLRNCSERRNYLGYKSHISSDGKSCDGISSSMTEIDVGGVEWGKLGKMG